MEKLVSQIAIKSDGNEFYEIYRERPYEISGMSPANVKSVVLLKGQWGTDGSVLAWSYTIVIDGEECEVKDTGEMIYEENKTISFKVVEGDSLKQYKSFKYILHVDVNGDDNSVTWILEYEKINKNVPAPQSIMDVIIATTKDIETHQLNPNPA